MAVPPFIRIDRRPDSSTAGLQHVTFLICSSSAGPRARLSACRERTRGAVCTSKDKDQPSGRSHILTDSRTGRQLREAGMVW